MTWLVVALVAIVLIALGAYVMDKQRSAALRRRFGPEYERALGDADGDRRAAEGRLRERLARRAELDVHDLDAAQRARFAARWQTVQVGFVDDPAAAVRTAESLVEEVVDARGYVSASSPTSATSPDGGADRDGDGVADRYEMLAVDHPALVERYRTARAAEAAGEIDDLRAAFLHHRALFQALLAAQDDGGRPRRDGDVRPEPEAVSP
jgi:hypothetical protein